MAETVKLEPQEDSSGWPIKVELEEVKVEYRNDESYEVPITFDAERTVIDEAIEASSNKDADIQEDPTPNSSDETSYNLQNNSSVKLKDIPPNQTYRILGDDAKIKKLPKMKHYICQVCKKVFFKTTDLDRHVKIHTGERPYKCNHCEKQFIRKDSLMKHTGIHTGMSPFECTICNKMFKRKEYLTKHLKIHSEENPYECPLCKKRFNRKEYIAAHMRIHAKEKKEELEKQKLQIEKQNL